MTNKPKLMLAVFPCTRAKSDFEAAFNNDEHREIDWFPSRMNSSTLRAMQELTHATYNLSKPAPLVDMCVFRITVLREKNQDRVIRVVDYLLFESLLDAFNDLIEDDKQINIEELFEQMTPVRF